VGKKKIKSYSLFLPLLSVAVMNVTGIHITSSSLVLSHTYLLVRVYPWAVCSLS